MAGIKLNNRITEKRFLDESEVAHYLGMGNSTFRRKRAGLEFLGFPQRHPIVKKRDRRAIDDWLDRISGLSSCEHDPLPSDLSELI